MVADSAGVRSHPYDGPMSGPTSSSPRTRRISRRIGAIAESATLKVDAKAKALKAEGRPVIGFGAGEPDFPTPDYVVEAAVDACRDPKNHRYTPAGGLPELKQAIADKTRRDSGYDVSPAQIVVTNGGKQAIYEAFATMLDPGDEVIVPAPYWTTYPEAIQLAGGVAVPVLADETQDYKVTVDQLEAARTERTKVLLFVSPSNPTGAVYDADEIRAIGRWVEDHELWVLTDEIYEHLVYDGVETGSLPVLCPELADSCVVVNGVAKTYAMTGWRVGWLIAPTDLAAAASNLQSHATSNVSNVAQRAALAAVTGDLSAVEEMKTAFDRRRRTIVSMLNEIEGVVCPTPEGAFYAYPSVKGLLGRDYDGRRIDDLGRPGRVHPRGGRGGRGARRGVRQPGLPAPVLRAGRRRPGGRRHPAPEALRLSQPRDVRTLPKAHLHLHFTGSMRHATLLELAERDGILLPDSLVTEWPPQLSAADEKGWFRFQRLYDVARSVLRTEDDVRRLVREAAEDDVRDGGRWLEIQVDPSGYGALLRRDHGVHRPRARRRPRGVGRDRSRHRRRDRRQPHPPPARRAHPGPARRAVRRPRRRRLRALQRRAPRVSPRSSRRPSPSPSGRG